MTPALLSAQPRLDKAGSDTASRPGSARVVLIDPREDRRAIMSMFVGRSPHLAVVGLAGSLSEAETQIQAKDADVALVEIQMPVTEGLTTIAALREHFPVLRIVVCSFHNDAATRVEARARGADGYLAKPFQVEDLLTIVDRPADPAPTGAQA